MGSAAGGGADPRIAPVRNVSGLLGLLCLVLAASPAGAQSARQVKVVLELQQHSQVGRQGVGGQGTVIVEQRRSGAGLLGQLLGR